MTDTDYSDRGWKPGDTPTPWLVRASDRLYQEVARAIDGGRLDARNPIADAALDYRDIRDEMAAHVQRDRLETGDEACSRLHLPYREEDDPALYALARCVCEQMDYEWDERPFHSQDGGTDHVYLLLLAQGDRDALRRLGYDIATMTESPVPFAKIPLERDAPDLWAFARASAESSGRSWDEMPLKNEDNDMAGECKLGFLNRAAQALTALRTRGYTIVASTPSPEGGTDA